MTHRIHDTIAELAVPIEGLQHYGGNPRSGNVKAIAESLEYHGQYKPVVVRTGTMEILAGNHTVKAARELGWTDIAATFVDVSDEQAARIVLVDNRTNDLAGYDESALADLLQGLPSLDGTGFDQEAVEALVHGVEQDTAEAPDSADEVPEKSPPIARLGDVFDLGPHRVICGDATDPAVLARLLEDERPHMMWTDPPYGVEYVGKTSEALRIENDGAVELDELLRAAFAAAAGVLRPGAPVYVAHSDTRRVTFEETLRAAGFLIRQNLIWVKNTIVLGHSDYQYKHEPILEAETASGNGSAASGNRSTASGNRSTASETDPAAGSTASGNGSAASRNAPAADPASAPADAVAAPAGGAADPAERSTDPADRSTASETDPAGGSAASADRSAASAADPAAGSAASPDRSTDPAADPAADSGTGKSHEPLLYGFAPGGSGRLGRGGPRWYGTNNRSTVFEVPKPPANRQHPTMKPVKLILEMMANSLRPGQLVLDPFAGSGSTLIAAHYHGAHARVVELDPRYVDVICARYQKETGHYPRRGDEAIDFFSEVA